MSSFNTIVPIFPKSSRVNTKKCITVHAAAEYSGYNIQYLRRMLRSGALEGIKIGQIWLIDMESLLAYLERVESTSDRRFGPK